jgi:short-subunit dehydrogenase
MPLAAPYHVTKFGVVALTESLFFEFALRKTMLGASVLCPAWVKTRILEAGRNRPEELKDHGVPPPDVALREAFQKRIDAEGLEPSFVAGRVFDAVRNNQSYILTHPEFKRVVQWRNENILNERNPILEDVLGGMTKELKQ